MYVVPAHDFISWHEHNLFNNHCKGRPVVSEGFNFFLLRNCLLGFSTYVWKNQTTNISKTNRIFHTLAHIFSGHQQSNPFSLDSSTIETRKPEYKHFPVNIRNSFLKNLIFWVRNPKWELISHYVKRENYIACEH